LAEKKVEGFRTFSGTALQEVVFPIGGIGTGTVGLHGSGRLVDWEIFNAPNKETEAPATAFLIRAKEQGRDPMTKVLASRRISPYVSYQTRGTKYHYTPFQFAGLPHMQGAEFTGEYPFAEITFRDTRLPLSVKLTAFNPMVPHDRRASSIPAAAFIYTLKNRRTTTVSASVGMSILNMTGLSVLPLDIRNTSTYRAFPKDTSHPCFGKNINSRIHGKGYKGLAMETGKYKQNEPGYGSMAIVAGSRGTSVRTCFPDDGWFDVMDYLWRDFSSDGRFEEDKGQTGPSPEGKSHVGGVSCSLRLNPGQSREIVFVLGWHFPNIPVYWDVCEKAPIMQRTNHYALDYKDAVQAAVFLFKHVDTLQKRSRQYINTLKKTTVPWHVKEAVANTASIIRSNTVQYFDDGFIHCFEGTDRSYGCCMGNCTHVWNYAHTMAYLFPSLERKCRETNFDTDILEDGSMHFRTRASSGCRVPVKIPAADGQMGSLIRLYREWRLSGDTDWLKKLWPGAKKAMEFAWQRWDKDRDGVMEMLQHNTYDIEFAGMNTLTGTYYLGALEATRQMALDAGDEEFAGQCASLFEKGSKEYLALWNGEYFEQTYNRQKAVREAEQIESFSNSVYYPSSLKGKKKDVKYQYGKGCLSDQVIGDWQARAAGLGGILPDAKIKKALRSIVKYNLIKDFSDFESVQRIYVLNEDSGLALCTWPRGGRPELPFPYSDEVWTGIEYQVAAHCAYMGLVKECFNITKTARERHDGIRRNPFNDVECGDHYARALASYSILNGLAGFEYSAVDQYIGCDPRISGGRFYTLYATGNSWGSIQVSETKHRSFRFTLTVMHGRERLKKVRLGVSEKSEQAAVSVDGKRVSSDAVYERGKTEVFFQQPVSLKAGNTLNITQRFST